MGQQRVGAEDRGLLKAMTAMGGGIASRGGPCGLLTGGVAFLGSQLGRDTAEERDRALLWRTCVLYHRRFEQEVASPWGSVDCRDIAGVDWDDPDDARAFYAGERFAVCLENAGKAARILGEVVERHLDRRAGERPAAR